MIVFEFMSFHVEFSSEWQAIPFKRVSYPMSLLYHTHFYISSSNTLFFIITFYVCEKSVYLVFTIDLIITAFCENLFMLVA